ncbi:MAG: hypothetical protein HUK11_07315 [Muribaculaceae bacterium]|nr:hypothetical protein [Muribaculaceae bacterium]
MKQEESEILKGLGKNPGFKVPDNYFEEFNKRMMDSLPEKKVEIIPYKPSLWLRVRPAVYAAATIAGIWCMISVFNHVNGSKTPKIGEIAEQLHQDDNADEVIMNGDMSEYDIITYQDSVMMEMEHQGDQLKKVTE